MKLMLNVRSMYGLIVYESSACFLVILVMNLELSWLNLMLYFGLVDDDDDDVKC